MSQKRRPTKLTIGKIEALRPNSELWDTLMPGLHIRAGKRGKSFYYYYRSLSGKERRPKVGSYGVLTIQGARDIVQQWASEIALGKDPKMELKRTVTSTEATLDDLKIKWDNELEKAQNLRKSIEENSKSENIKAVRHPNRRRRRKPLGELKPSTLRGFKTAWCYLIGKFGKAYRLNQFTTETLDGWMDELAQNHGPAMANQVMAHTSSLLGWSIDWKLRAKYLGNPANGIGKFHIPKRTRIIKPEEGPRFKAVLSQWLVSKDNGQKKIARLIVLCLFNSNRRSEFLNARLRMMDWDQGKLMLSDSKVGEVEVVLGEESLKVLIDRYNEWERAGANPDHDWVIPGRYPDRPLKEPKKLWKEFLEEAGVEGLTLHDLRRSFTSIGLSSLMFGLDQMGQVLKHKNPQTTRGYAYMMDHAHRAVLNTTGEQINELLDGQFQYANQHVPESIKKQRELLPLSGTEKIVF